MKPAHRTRKKRQPQRATPAGQHLPVMLDQVLEVLNPKAGQIALDCTLGFAGHAAALLRRLGSTGKLIGVDVDGENLPRARKALEEIGLPFCIQRANFAGIATIVANEDQGGVDLLLADLGMSSMQLDDPERGFSYVRDGPLDMRMDRSRGPTAAELLQTISELDLAAALRDFGDEPASDTIARELVARRDRRALVRTADICAVVSQAVGKPATRTTGWRLHPSDAKWTVHPAARTFQALRILVNRELANLRHLSRVLPDVVRPGGVAAIISFHSGEDRLVKAEFRNGLTAGRYLRISPTPLRPTEEEKRLNPRSRSAKLRWAERK